MLVPKTCNRCHKVDLTLDRKRPAQVRCVCYTRSVYFRADYWEDIKIGVEIWNYLLTRDPQHVVYLPPNHWECPHCNAAPGPFSGLNMLTVSELEDHQNYKTRYVYSSIAPVACLSCGWDGIVTDVVEQEAEYNNVTDRMTLYDTAELLP